MSVTQVLCLMMMLRILSFSLTFSIFLSMVSWLVSSFFTHPYVRDHVWHPYVIAGKTHWLTTFLFRLMGRRLFPPPLPLKKKKKKKKISVLSKKHPILLLFLSKLLALFCFPLLLFVPDICYFCPVYLCVVYCVDICHKLGFSFMYLKTNTMFNC